MTKAIEDESSFRVALEAQYNQKMLQYETALLERAEVSARMALIRAWFQETRGLAKMLGIEDWSLSEPAD